MTTKNIWRAQMLAARSEIGPGKIAEFNRDICKNLSFVWTEAGGLGNPKSKPLWAGYKSFRWEADPSEAIAESSPYLRWCYPRVLEDHKLEFLEPPAHDAVWVKNTWGIWEPDFRGADKISINECAGVLLPAVAFDREGHRLGYGKGFYDRGLAEFKGLKVGVSFSVQLAPVSLPSDASDVTVNLIVTDKEIIRIGERH